MNPFETDKSSAWPFTRRRFLRLLGGLTASGAVLTTASAADDHGEILEQKPGTGACVPCAVANALLNGDADARRAFRALPGNDSVARLDALIARYGAKPSETYGPKRSRFVNGLGIATDDVPHLTNDLLADANLPGVRGTWLDGLPAERDNQRGHLRRIHGLFKNALARGLPPVIEVRAFATNRATPKEPWNNWYAHWLTLLSLEPAGELPAGASGFLCRFADSFTGRQIAAFAYAERFRPFMATRGFTVRADGKKDWHWLTGQPFILLQLPDVPMNLEICPPQERAVVALTYLVGRAA